MSLSLLSCYLQWWRLRNLRENAISSQWEQAHMNEIVSEMSYFKSQKRFLKGSAALVIQKVNWARGTLGTYHNILRECVSAKGAIIKHDLIEGLWCYGDHSAAIVPSVPMFRDDGLPHGDALLASLELLKMSRKRREKRMRRKKRGKERK